MDSGVVKTMCRAVLLDVPREGFLSENNRLFLRKEEVDSVMDSGAVSCRLAIRRVLDALYADKHDDTRIQ